MAKKKRTVTLFSFAVVDPDQLARLRFISEQPGPSVGQQIREGIRLWLALPKNRIDARRFRQWQRTRRKRVR
jgi:hypothetical protein